MGRSASSATVPLHRGLTIVVAAVLVVAVGVANTAVYLALAAYLNERLDNTLRDTPDLFVGAVGDAGDRGAPPAEPDSDPTTGPRAEPFLERIDTDGTVLRTQSGEDLSGQHFTADLPSPLPELTWSDIAGGEAAFFDARSREPGGPRLRVKVSVDAQGRTLVIAVPRTEVDTLLNRLMLVQVCVSVGVLLVACCAAWWLVRRRTAPLRRLARAVEKLTPDDLAARVHIDTTAREVDELATATNVLLGRMDEAFAKEQASQERLRQFVADASHELRTPIAAVSAYAQLFELGARDRPADLARSMSGIRREATRMRDLAEELLTLAAAEEGPPELQAVDVATVLGQAVDAALATDPRWPVTLSLARDVATVAAEPAGLRRVLDNLIGNVRTHTPAGTPTRVAARRRGQAVVISVADDGPGLGADDRTHMFDRFWRKDSSRSRQGGGSGLGLSIVATLVESWHGRVTAEETRPGRGLTVTVVVPAVSRPSPPAPAGQRLVGPAAGAG